jgi:Calcineurin-like phosphoesterase superfamily domain/N-6 DNA Methylase
MFVQSSHFIEDAGQDTMKRVTFYGHEKNETTARLAQINLAVHGLQGAIRAGNEAITYYRDPHELPAGCQQGEEGLERQLPVDLLFLQLPERDRPGGFVMSSQASSAGRDEALVRKKLLAVHSTAWEPRGAYVYPHSALLERFAEADADFVLYGHTHHQLIRRCGKVLVINPGSAGDARDPGNGRQLSCAVLDPSSESEEVVVTNFA